jgi:DNA polymerase III subunit epsilon
MMVLQTFAVLDLETTGLFPGGHDRVVEVGIVQLGDHCGIEGEYGTLVNPERDLGPAHIHRISAAQVRDAPKFVEVIDDMVHWLGGRVVVGHNVAFDLQFLKAEFARLGHVLPAIPTIDTMALAGGGSLLDCCSRFGLENPQAHCALDDARAAAALFRAICSNEPAAAASMRSSLPPSPPATAWPQLVYAATEYHRPARPVSDAGGALPELHAGAVVCFTGTPGVCLNGRALERGWATQLAEERGLKVASGVTRKLSVLVAADPDSLSGKAAKARQYGIPIVSELVFWRALGVDVRARLEEEVE